MDLLRAISEVQRGYAQKITPTLQEKYGIDLRQFLLVARIKMGDLYPGDLARGALETPSQITRQLDKLESLGFVTRQLDRDDSRRIRLGLTDSGRQMIERVDAILVASLGPPFGRLDPSVRQTLISGLRTVAAGLSALKAPEPV